VNRLNKTGAYRCYWKSAKIKLPMSHLPEDLSKKDLEASD
jgi:hypothetical protein